VNTILGSARAAGEKKNCPASALEGRARRRKLKQRSVEIRTALWEGRRTSTSGEGKVVQAKRWRRKGTGLQRASFLPEGSSPCQKRLRNRQSAASAAKGKKTKTPPQTKKDLREREARRHPISRLREKSSAADQRGKALSYSLIAGTCVQKRRSGQRRAAIPGRKKDSRAQRALMRRKAPHEK